MKTVLLHSALLGAALSLVSFTLPTGWFAAGSQPKSYEMGIAAGSGQSGKNAATIKSIETGVTGFGTLMQNSSPGKFLGKRVRMTGYLKSQDVTGWAGFWLRVDKAGASRPLAFDNMQERAVKGTTDWKKYELVLDVPADATNLAYGALLDQTGQIWFDNIRFEVVDATVPVSGRQQALPTAPTNLNFEE